MKNYVYYFRVSTSKQGLDGLGINSQRQSVTNYVKSVNGNVVGEFTEVESGKTIERISVDSMVSINTLINNRPKLQAAIQFAKENDAIIVVKESSRLSRSSLFISFLIDAGVRFVCSDSPQDSEMIVRIKTILAEDEVKKVSARTKAGLLEIRRNISKNGFHISKKGNMIKKLGNPANIIAYNARPRERKVALQMVKAKSYVESLRKNGMTLEIISEKLNSDGYRTPNNCMFSKGQVSRLLKQA